MPELPEVETVVRQLDPLVRGREVRRLELLDPLLGALSPRLVGRRHVARVLRLGKQVVLELEAGQAGVGPRLRAPAWLAVHLRMTGRLLWWPDGKGPEPKHVRARLWLQGGKLLFADVRRFGTIALTADREALQPVGVDPLEASFTCELLGQQLVRSKQAIKVWLLRQDRLVGLGNIYACEILFEAGIDPRRPADDLVAGEVERLHGAIGEVLRRAIDNCGTTFSDFQDAHGVTGSYQHHLRVYGREGQPCAVCGGVIERLVQQQRSTFYCARCQAAGRPTARTGQASKGDSRPVDRGEP